MFQRILIISILFFNAQFIAFPQYHRIRFEHLSIEDGLSQNTVEAIFQDSKGFMWFATIDGLNKYDGYNFTVYRHNTTDSTSIADNFIYCIYEDDCKNLWLGSNNGGLIKFNRQNETFTSYQHNPSNVFSISNNHVQCIYEDSNNILWIGTSNGGLNKFDRKTKKFEHFKHEPDNFNSISNNNVQTIIEDRNNVLWIGTINGLNKFIEEEDRFVKFYHDTEDPKSISNNTIISLLEDKSGKIWCGTDNGLNQLNPVSNKFKRFLYDAEKEDKPSSEQIITILEDKSGKLWFGTASGGLLQYVQDKNKFISWKHDPVNPFSISNNSIISLYEDKSGIIWIGTAANGVNKYVPQKNNFLHFKNNPFIKGSLNHNTIRCFYEDELGRLWVGTIGGGVNILDRNTGNFKQYLPDPKNSGSINHNVITSITKDKHGSMWIGTWGNGLNRLDNKEKSLEISIHDKFIHYTHDPQSDNSLSDNIIQIIFEDSKGNLWIGTGNGLDLYDRENDGFIQFQNNPENPHSIGNNQIQSCIVEDSIGNIWIGSWNGLIRMLPTKEFMNYRNDPQNINSLSDNRVISLCLSKNGSLWIGTFGGGLTKLSIDNSDKEEIIKFTRCTLKDDLLNKVIYGIQEDNNGNLWLSTNNGLIKFNPYNGSFKNYDVSDGLQSKQFNWGASLKGKNGEMFFGGINGFNIFMPDSLKDNTHIPEVVITDFRIFNKPVAINKDNSPLNKHISETSKITLSYKYSVFSFEFAALEYSAPEKNYYAYMLEGFDEDWNYLGNTHTVTYTNLAPGKYTFKVKACNNDGVWNVEGTSITLIITPPYWETWWFRISVVLFSLVALYGFLLVKIKNIQKQKYILKENIDERTKELFDANNSLIDINKELEEHKKNLEGIVSERTADLEIAKNKAEESDRLKSAFLANMSHEIRTPLNAIVGFSSLITNSNLLVKQKNEISYHINHNSDTLLHLIDDIIDLSKIESGQLKIDEKECKIDKIFNLLFETFNEKRENLSKNKIEIKINNKLKKDNLIIYTDPIRLQQILSNLIDNALKFTEKGFIEYGCFLSAENNQELTFYVKDTGIGLSPDQQNQIFNRFNKIEEDKRKLYRGAGLGLSISKNLAELLGGKLWVESEKDKGSIFYFTLPFTKLAKNEIIS